MPSSSPTEASTFASSNADILTAEDIKRAMIEMTLGTSPPRTYREAERLQKQYQLLYQYNLLDAFTRGPIASGAPYMPEIEVAIDAEEARRIMLRARLGLRSGEELISVAVRKDDGSIETRPA